MRVAVVGGGVFGIAGALELARRGHEVTLVDPGPLPHPDAASTDISKLIRMDYGGDVAYTALMERALDGWRRWNAGWERPLYHEVGLLVMAPDLEAPGFEGDSARLLSARGHALNRLDRAALETAFPMWRGQGSAYVNPAAGWAESGAVVAALAREALAAGVTHVARAAIGWIGEAQVAGVRVAGGEIPADRVVVAPGAWVASLLPELADRIRAIGQPVLHFRPADPDRWRPPRFLPWAADIARTGWYGFPATADGIVKVANHGPGVAVDPAGPRVVDPAWEARFRAFFAAHLPGLADAPKVGDRLCLYADSFDGDFLIDAHPHREGMIVAGGGSGHGFKFAPVLGGLIADAVEGAHGPEGARFRWRVLGARRTEDARFDG